MGRRTALITGVFGQDGSLLAELLLSRGYRVVGIARPGSAPKTDGRATEVELVEVDLANPAQVRAAIVTWQPDELYHLAASHHSSQDKSLSDAIAGKAAMVSTNFLSTQVLAFALSEMRAACHLIFASSSQVFTPSQMIHPIDESTPRRPETFYGWTKSWSMDLLAHLRVESALHASSAILFNHESSRRGAQFVSRKITRAAASAASGRPLALHLQNIGSRVDWSNAHDAVEALSLMGREEQGADYVVASGQLHSVKELLEIAFGSVGLDWAKYTTFDEDRDAPALVGDSGALQRASGWERVHSFESTIRDMVSHDR